MSLANSLLFIHIPKTGGTSVRTALGLGKVDHSKASEIRDDVWDRSTTISVVRNPYSRLLSQWAYHCTTEYQGNLLRTVPNLKGMSFRDYLSSVVSVSSDPMFSSMVEFLERRPTTIEIDFLLRFESLNSDFQLMVKRLGLKTTLPHLNASNSEAYLDKMRKWERDFIYQLYRTDFETFGYPRRF